MRAGLDGVRSFLLVVVDAGVPPQNAPTDRASLDDSVQQERSTFSWLVVVERPQQLGPKTLPSNSPLAAGCEFRCEYMLDAGLDFLFHMFFLARYCRLLEEGSFRGRTADFFYMLVFGAPPAYISPCLLALAS